MVDRPNKPSTLSTTSSLPPQPQVSITHANERVSAVLPSGESVEVLLHGATVISWKDASGAEKIWLSKAAKLDGSKAVRGGIPLVFPVFGTAPDHEQTKSLPQHGFARNSHWEFLGKSSSEAATSSTVKLDFGLSSETLDADSKAKWPYTFNLIYSVTLDKDSLNTTLVVSNDGDETFDCQLLMHSYFRINDITSVSISGFEDSSYIDKVDKASTKTQAGDITFSGETDSVYTPAKGTQHPIIVSEGGKPVFRIVRDNLENVVVWNPWTDKAAGMADFEPKDGWKQMVCVEAGSVKGWQKLEKGDTFEGSQTINLG